MWKVDYFFNNKYRISIPTQLFPLYNRKNQSKDFLFIDNSTILLSYICKQDNKDLPHPKSLTTRGMLCGKATMEDITMKRKPKMHNEQEFNLDNIYQEDDRQLDNLDDTSFDMRYK